MIIDYAILGMLDCRPMTGYDLKKIIQDSNYMYWSGNNNQIYKALTELLNDNLVTSVTEYSEKTPAKKIYTITEKGREELRNWAKSAPEPAEFKKAFLIQMAWADILDSAELHQLLADYENEVRLQIIMKCEKIRRGGAFSPRTEREALLWKAIDDNILSSYQNELEWIKKIRRQLEEFEPERLEVKMNYRINDNGSIKYMELISSADPITTEQDALELISLCGGNETDKLLIHNSCLTEDFFNLKTGVAGAILQKFINYRMKIAVVIPEQSGLGKRFRELMSEANQGREYCFVVSTNEAEKWFQRSELI